MEQLRKLKENFVYFLFSFCESCVLNDGVLLTNKEKNTRNKKRNELLLFFCLFSSIHCSILCLQLNNYKARTVSALVLALCIQRDKGKEKQQKRPHANHKNARCAFPLRLGKEAAPSMKLHFSPPCPVVLFSAILFRNG